MNHKPDMILSLLESYELLVSVADSREIFVKRVFSWIDQVSIALRVCGMDDDERLWNESTGTISFSLEDLSFPAAMIARKAILVGILERVSGGESLSGLLDIEIVSEAPLYIQRIAHEANGCYERDWYDACAVMLRRLIESLIIECYEGRSLDLSIKTSDGTFMALGELIMKCINEKSWTLSRNTRNYLPKLKELGDISAHSRRFLAGRSDIDRVATALRICIQELCYIAVTSRSLARWFCAITQTAKLLLPLPLHRVVD